MAVEARESIRERTPDGIREGGKLFFDTMKHQTTLSTGSLLLLVTFVEKLFPNPSSKWLMIAVFSLLTMSLISAFLAMLIITKTVMFAGNLTNTEKKFGTAFSLSATGFFLLGLIALVVFAGINIY